MLQFEDFVFNYGYIAVFTFLALGIFGLPMPDELVVTFVGYLTSTGLLNYKEAIVITILGVMTGTIVTFLIGRKFGKPVMEKYGKWVGLKQSRLQLIEAWFNRYGPWAVTIGYFVPGMRHFVCYLSGMSGMNVSRYLFFATIGTCVSCIVCLTIGYLIGFPL